MPLRAGLELEQVGADRLHPLAPVAAHAHRLAVVLEDFHRLIAEFAQFRGIGTTEPCLNAPASPGPRRNFLAMALAFG